MKAPNGLRALEHVREHFEHKPWGVRKNTESPKVAMVTL